MWVSLRRAVTIATGLMVAVVVALSAASLGHVDTNTPAHYVAGGMGPHR